MKAIRVHQFGAAGALKYEDAPTPEAHAGEVRIKLAASGLNYIDIYHRSGAYQMPAPFVPGLEGAGIVDQVGEGVTDVKVGDRVAYPNFRASYAEYVVIPVEQVVPVPASIDLTTAAAVMLQGMTAHFLATSTFPIQPGNKALVHAAAGGLGQLLVQIIKLRGGWVVGSVSTAEKAQVAKAAGADEVIIYPNKTSKARPNGSPVARVSMSSMIPSAKRPLRRGSTACVRVATWSCAVKPAVRLTLSTHKFSTSVAHSSSHAPVLASISPHAPSCSSAPRDLFDWIIGEKAGRPHRQNLPVGASCRSPSLYGSAYDQGQSAAHPLTPSPNNKPSRTIQLECPGVLVNGEFTFLPEALCLPGGLSANDIVRFLTPRERSQPAVSGWQSTLPVRHSGIPCRSPLGSPQYDCRDRGGYS